MSMQKIRVDIQDNQDIVNFLTEKLDELSLIVNVFFEYLIIPREGYIQINKTNIKSGMINPPVITGQMIDYVIRNILNVVYDIEVTVESSYLQVFKSLKAKYKTQGTLTTNEEYSSDDYSILFFGHMSGKVNDLFNELQKATTTIDKIEIPVFPKTLPYIDDSVELSIIRYLNYLLMMIYSNDRTELMENIDLYNMKEGSNTFSPRDYGFLDDQSNITLQSFIWILSGLTDWIEKDYIEEEDVKYLIKIMSNIKNIKVGNEVNEVQEMNIRNAFFVNNFLISDKATRQLSNYLNLVKDEEHLVKKFSVII